MKWTVFPDVWPFGYDKSKKGRRIMLIAVSDAEFLVTDMETGDVYTVPIENVRMDTSKVAEEAENE